MGLMTGTGPLGRKPTGTFNFEPPPPGRSLYLEPTPKRVRVEVAGETVADSRRVILLQESGLQPVYYFPREDVRLDLLEPSDRHTRCPTKGEASYYSIKVGERVVENGAWYYPSPIEGASAIGDMIAFYWDRVDRWLEEDEEIFVHPRDPYHRIDVLRTDRHVRVSIVGELLADSRRAIALFESNLPPRWYLPREDVVAELVPSDTVTRCGYKGEASYYSVRLADGETVRNLAWTYTDPLPEAARIEGMLCFFNERIDLELDGELQERPESAWSRGVRS
jgi:uncharacterized protein (DUF427 family)